jgi:hypothetical protein
MRKEDKESNSLPKRQLFSFEKLKLIYYSFFVDLKHFYFKIFISSEHFIPAPFM